MNTPRTSVGRRQAPRGRLSPAIVAGSLALALAACKHTSEVEVVGSVPSDYRLNHPIAIEDKVQTVDIPVSMNGARLTEGVRGNVNGFAQRFLASGAAVIAIVTPSGSADETAAIWLSYQIKDVLVASGVDPKAIDFRVYRARGERTPPIRIAFSAVAATTAGCGPWTDQVATNKNNVNYGNFGCATQQNLAAIVANPLDLIYPRGMTPADATRRATVLEKYEKGESYQSDYSRETGGTVAKGVGG
ncbi:MAG TPA: CpaD family pilus assembly protein [Bauldia sp.]|nr:CpaD family pilus assembly protein [Bauldia sp.]